VGVESEMGMSIGFSGEMDFCVFVCMSGETGMCMCVQKD